MTPPQFQSWSSPGDHLKGSDMHMSKRKPILDDGYGGHSAATDDVDHSHTPVKKARVEADVPLRFVSVTPHNILSGDIHRTQGEWKRGRPRLSKSSSKTKTPRSPAAPHAEQLPKTGVEPRQTPEAVDDKLVSTVSHGLFGPVFDNLLVTDQERDFFERLFVPGAHH
jgi:hypothetical protein